MFCSRKRHVKAQKEGNKASQKERGSLIFLHHNIKDGSYNSMNINKQLSPAENAPALQANKVDESWPSLGSDPQWFNSCKQPPPIRELEVLTLYILAGRLLDVWLYRVFSHDVTVAILVSQSNEMEAILVSQTNPVAVELFSYENSSFCSSKLA